MMKIDFVINLVDLFLGSQTKGDLKDGMRKGLLTGGEMVEKNWTDKQFKKRFRDYDNLSKEN
jgi:hypothetical protein